MSCHRKLRPRGRPRWRRRCPSVNRSGRPVEHCGGARCQPPLLLINYDNKRGPVTDTTSSAAVVAVSKSPPLPTGMKISHGTATTRYRVKTRPRLNRGRPASGWPLARHCCAMVGDASPRGSAERPRARSQREERNSVRLPHARTDAGSSGTDSHVYFPSARDCSAGA